MDELERRLRELDPPLPPPRPVAQLRERARRRRVRRRATTVSAAVVAAAAVVVTASALWPGGGPTVVLDGSGDEDADEPAVAPSGEPSSSPPAASGDAAGGAFVPDSRTEDGRTVVPVTFPDGTTGELVYPADLALVDEGVTPHVRVGIAPEEAGEPPLRRSLELHRGRVEDVLTRVNGGRSPRQVATYPDDVALWDMADGVLGHDYLAWQVGGWTVLMADRIRDGAAVPEMSPAQREALATRIAGRETPDGLPVFELSAPVERVGDAQLLLGAPQRAIEVVRDVTTAPGRGPLVQVSASGCVEGDDPAHRWCQGDAQVSFAAWGEQAFVDAVRTGLAIRDVTLAAGIIDPAWVTSQERAGWEEANGEATWVPGLFYTTRPWLAPEAHELALRWRRIADEPLGLGHQERARRAFAHLDGPPPPGLVTALQGVPMRVRSAAVDDGVVTIDFDDAIVRPTSLGSSAGIATATQIEAQVRHLYPQAHTLCILVDGRGGLAEPGPYLFHEAEGCPRPLTGASPYAHGQPGQR